MNERNANMCSTRKTGGSAFMNERGLNRAETHEGNQQSIEKGGMGKTIDGNIKQTD